MTIYALDTNILSHFLKKNSEIIKLLQKTTDEGNTLVIPAAAYYEIRRGLIAVNATTQAQAFSKLCDVLDVEEMSVDIWEKSAEIWAALRDKGTPLGKDDGDIFIAAQCIVNDYTLVTDDTGDFERIDGLKFVNWVQR